MMMKINLIFLKLNSISINNNNDIIILIVFLTFASSFSSSSSSSVILVGVIDTGDDSIFCGVSSSVDNENKSLSFNEGEP